VCNTSVPSSGHASTRQTATQTTRKPSRRPSSKSSIEHTHTCLEDALDLARIVERPPEADSTKRAIEHVVEDACSHLDAWGRFGPENATSPCEHERARV
jgi:hypothetical protein